MNFPKKLRVNIIYESNPPSDLTALPATDDFYPHLAGWRVLISNPAAVVAEVEVLYYI